MRHARFCDRVPHDSSQFFGLPLFFYACSPLSSQPPSLLLQNSSSVSARLAFAQPLVSPRIASPLARMQTANDELFRIGNAYEIIHRESVSALGRLKVRSHLAATKGKGCCEDEAHQPLTSLAQLSSDRRHSGLG